MMVIFVLLNYANDLISSSSTLMNSDFKQNNNRNNFSMEKQRASQSHVLTGQKLKKKCSTLELELLEGCLNCRQSE